MMHPFAGPRGHSYGDHVVAETGAAGNAVAGTAVESSPVAACARVVALSRQTLDSEADFHQ